MKLVDTHCHLHDSEFFADPSEQQVVYQRAINDDVAMICVGTSVKSSQEAIDFVIDHEQTWAVLGVHPHDARQGCDSIGKLLADRHDKVVGIGEIGLDYFYDNSPRAQQIAVLEQQLQWAMEYRLPVSFHVREAFDDFWPVLDNFSSIRGVLHSFTDSQVNLERGFERGLYIGINGISTFTKDAAQQEMYGHIPLDRMLLETDAPFLTPAPLRGKMNEPSYVGRVAEHAAALRGVSVDVISRATTDNARRLFAI